MSGFFVGIANALKSVAPVLIIAVAIVVVLKFLQERIEKKRMFVLFTSIVLFAGLSLGMNKVALRYSSDILGMECKDLNTWHFINVGLNPYGAGSVAHGKGHYYSNFIKSGIDPDDARDMMFEKVIADWKEAEINVSEFLYIKGFAAWADGAQDFTKLMFNSVDRENFSPIQSLFWRIMQGSVPMLSQLWHTVTMLLALVGTLHIFIKRLENSGSFLISLHTFGFALMLLISEVQARYKSNIIHLIAVLAAIGLWRIYTRKNSTDAVDTDTEKEKVRS